MSLFSSFPNARRTSGAGSYFCRWVLVTALFSLLLFSGCASRKPPSIPVQFYVEVNYPTEENQHYTAKQLLSRIGANPVIVGSEILAVDLVRVDLGMCLLFQLNTQASFRLYNITAQNLGKRLILVINDEPVGVRNIDEIISNGRLFTFLDLPDSELPSLVVGLQEDLKKQQKR